MSAHLLVEGRLLSDVSVRETKSGSMMANALIAARVESRSDGLDDSMVFGIVAFGEAAEALRLHAKGDTVAVTGVLQRQVWNDELRFSILADSIESARTSRERARRRRSEAQAA